MRSGPDEKKFPLPKNGKLDLQKLGLTFEDMPALVMYLKQNPDIIDLDLSDNAIGNEGAKLLAELTGIKKLKVKNCQLTTAGVNALAKGKIGQDCTDLDLSENHLVHNNLVNIRYEMRSLTRLNIDNCHLGSQFSLSLFVDPPQHSSLIEISVRGNEIFQRDPEQDAKIHAIQTSLGIRHDIDAPHLAAMQLHDKALHSLAINKQLNIIMDGVPAKKLEEIRNRIAAERHSATLETERKRIDAEAGLPEQLKSEAEAHQKHKKLLTDDTQALKNMAFSTVKPSQIKELMKSLEQLQKENMQIDTNLAVHIEKKFSWLETKLAEQKESRANIELKIAELNTAHHSLTKALESLRESVEVHQTQLGPQNEALYQRALTDLQKSSDAAVVKMTEIAQQRSAIQEQLAANAKKLGELKATFAIEEKKISDATAAINQTKTSMSSQLEQKISGHNVIIDLAERRLTKAKDELAELKKLSAEREKHKAASSRGNTRQWQDETAKFILKIRENIKALEALAPKPGSKEEKQLVEAKASLGILQQQLNLYKEQELKYRSSEASIKQLQIEIQRAQDALDKAQAARAQILAEITAAHTTTTEALLHEIKLYKTTMDKIEVEQAKIQAENTILQTKVEKLTKDIKSEEEIIRKNIDESKRIEEKQTAAKAIVPDLQAQITSLVIRIDKNRDEHKAEQANLAIIDDRIQQQKDHIEIIKQEAETDRKERAGIISSAERELEQVKVRLNAETKEVLDNIKFYIHLMYPETKKAPPEIQQQLKIIDGNSTLDSITHLENVRQLAIAARRKSGARHNTKMLQYLDLFSPSAENKFNEVFGKIEVTQQDIITKTEEMKKAIEDPRLKAVGKGFFGVGGTRIQTVQGQSLNVPSYAARQHAMLKQPLSPENYKKAIMIGRYAALNDHTTRSKKTQAYYESHLSGRKRDMTIDLDAVKSPAKRAKR